MPPIDRAACDISLGNYRGPLDAALAGLQRARLDGAMLELDGGSRELSSFVQARSASRPELAEANRRARQGRFRLGPIVIGGSALMLPIEGDNLAQLRVVLERHHDWDIAIELNVRDNDGYLIEAPDVGDNEIWVSSRLPKESISALRAALAGNLRASPD